MITANSCRGKIVYVLGLGTSGHGALNSLLAAESIVFAWDDNANNRVPIEGVTYVDCNDLNLREIDLLIVSPGIDIFWPKPHPAMAYARRHMIPVVCDIDLFMYNRPPRTDCIGVTGTNGKSTTVSLIAHIFNSGKGNKAVVGGNIGTSALSQPVLSGGESYVLELSSYQLEIMEAFDFKVSVLLNITQDHLARHSNMIGYANAKQKILQNLSFGGYGVIGQDDPCCREIYGAFPKYEKLIPISGCFVPEKGIGWDDENLIDNVEGKRIIVLNSQNTGALYGQHNRQNIAAAYAVCCAKGVNAADFSSALGSFKPLRHRQELVDTSMPFKIINDSKATNLDACVKALMQGGSIYWIAGGLAKGPDFSELKGSHLKNVKKAFLIGDAADLIYKFLQQESVESEICGTLEAATKQALEAAYLDYNDSKSQNISVVLAPACASFDQFDGFEHRGDAFISLVKAWCAKHSVG
ncbi:MAG: UDP-N-acetylmuramoyl-L-alanine--D-glutamate ligase [Holosporales bacterium]|jgi:UDP-N-acetylmuramoylalanine--D-glutamate ligase|nr:UDP-N-acetylmuramoyl-L-alanine--D-glutamate ligase [Holosporales bacterium]